MEKVPTIFGPGDFHAAVQYAGAQGRNSAAGGCAEGDDEGRKGKTSWSSDDAIRHANSSKSLPKFYVMWCILSWIIPTIREIADVATPSMHISAYWPGDASNSKIAIQNSNSKMHLYLITKKRECFARCRLFSCKRKGNRNSNMLETTKRRICKYNGIATVSNSRQVARKITIVMKHFRWLVAWYPPPKVWFK